MPNKPATLVPIRNVDCNVLSLPLTPLEHFVLTKVDGVLDISGIATVAGLDEHVVKETIVRLHDLHALTIPNRPRRVQKKRSPPASSKPRNARAAMTDDPAPSPVERSPSTRTATLQRDAEEVDLSEELKRFITEMYARREQMTFYEVLGVSLEADRQQVRRAYNALVVKLHPDRYFRKRLGSYQKKMEQLLKLATDAERTLGRKKLRASYDATLTKEQRARISRVYQEDVID